MARLNAAEMPRKIEAKGKSLLERHAMQCTKARRGIRISVGCHASLIRHANALSNVGADCKGAL